MTGDTGLGFIDAGEEPAVVDSDRLPTILVPAVCRHNNILSKPRLGCDLILSREVPPLVEMEADGWGLVLPDDIQHLEAFGDTPTLYCQRVRLDPDEQIVPVDDRGNIEGWGITLLDASDGMAKKLEGRGQM